MSPTEWSRMFTSSSACIELSSSLLSIAFGGSAFGFTLITGSKIGADMMSYPSSFEGSHCASVSGPASCYFWADIN